MELIEEMKDDVHAFIVDAEIGLQIPDQPCPCNVHVREVRSDARLIWNEPALLKPVFQRLRLEACICQKLLLVHDHDALSSRGLNVFPLSQLETNASSSGSGDLGRTTLSLTNRSPWPPSRRGAPFPRKRMVVPVFDPFGTVMVTSPVGVGTRIRPPSTASVNEIGTSREMSSPSRVKRRSGT